ncbi:MAG: hypothetical protein PX637_21550 [Microcystis sp. M53601_WE4]|nr:hypothetical protein [Microcystis sp. M53601_WE4]
MSPSKSVKPHTPHPTPHTLPPPKNFLPQTLFKPRVDLAYAKKRGIKIDRS